MKIGIIGADSVCSNIAKKIVRAGYQVKITKSHINDLLIYEKMLFNGANLKRLLDYIIAKLK